ncbi:MAG: M23 family metallopeptidase [Desulfobacterota bacterium]|nr:M23 family metallopeptidase [Thermodesulfobacteriota bacterium]
MPEKKAPRGVYHTVQRGETLWRICNAYGVNMQDVAELNNIQDPSKINVGDRIFIPGASRVKKIMSLQKDSPKQKEQEPPIVLQHGLFQWPVRGKILRGYGIIDNQKHDGITILVAPGSPVYAAAAGKVAFADFLKGYGSTIIINHNDGFATVYAMIGKILVTQGQEVKKGQIIAEVARSPEAAQPSLHFQIRKNNETRNPLFYLPQ